MATPTFNFHPASDTAANSDFTMVSFTGKEAISTLFEFKLTVKLVLDDDASGLFDGNFIFRMAHDGGEKNYAGVVAGYREVSPAGATAGYKYYEVTFAPHLWSRTLGIRSQIYVGKTVDEILDDEITEITDDNGNVEIEKSLTGTYSARPFTCQYKENNFNFMSRMMEHYGIYAYFEHGTQAAKLRLADDAAYESIATILSGSSTNELSYNPAPTGDLYFSSIQTLLSEVKTIEDGVRVHGDNPDQPSSPFDDSYPAGSSGVISELASENPVSQADASQLAQVRFEALDIYSSKWNGGSGICLLAPGYTFTTPQVTTPTSLLIIEVVHSGDGLDQSFSGSGSTATYNNTFQCVDGTKQYRPLRISDIPQVYNIETGTVYADQTDTSLAEIDGDGRYRVEFNFLPGIENVDSSSSETDKKKVSHWVRMSQSASGIHDGLYVPLKAGVEVTLSFIGGNPDRPIITGTLSNGSYPSLVNSQNSNEAILSTQGLLSLVSLGGSHRYSKTNDAEEPESGDTVPVDFSDHSVKTTGLNPNPRNQDENNKPDKTFNPGVTGTELSLADEISGDYHIQRRYGDFYTKTYGNYIKAHYGNTYDYSSNWTYSYGNGYGETHMDYGATVNHKTSEDLLNIGGADWSNLTWPDAKGEDTTLDGNTPKPELWSNGNVWVSKTYGGSKDDAGGRSYNYTEGDTVSVSKNVSTLDIKHGSGLTQTEVIYRGSSTAGSIGSLKSWSRTGSMSGGKYGTELKKWNSAGKNTYSLKTTYKGKPNNDYETVSEEKKYNKGGKKYYEKSETFTTPLGITAISEKKWNYLLGDTPPPYSDSQTFEVDELKTSHFINRKATVETSTNFATATSASINLAATASSSINLAGTATAKLDLGASVSASISLGLKADFELSAAASSKIGIGAALDFKMYWNPSGAVTLKNGTFEYHGIGSKLDKDAALKAKKQELYLHYMTAHFSKREMGLISTAVKVEAEKLGIKEGFSINL